jgi:predicted RNA-binding Zn-ribbon protein involved in translation (DUF1610 family)
MDKSTTPPIIIPPIAVSVQPCRGCGKEFSQCESDKHSAKYYRCPECTSDKALLRSIICSCTIS